MEIIGSWVDGDGAAESAWVQDTERHLDAHARPSGWANLMARGDQRATTLLVVKLHYDPDGMFSPVPLPDEPGTGTNPAIQPF